MGALKAFRKLRELFDVVWGTPSNGEVLTYSSANDKATWNRFDVTSLAGPDGESGLLRVPGDGGGPEVITVVPSITGATTQEQVDSLVQALVTLGLCTDDR